MSIQVALVQMKIRQLFTCITFFGIVGSQQAKAADIEQVKMQDQFGFTQCFTLKQQSYVLEWDRYVGAQHKKVSYYKLNDYSKEAKHQINDCSEIKYIHEVPAEILKPITELEDEISEKLKFEIKQIETGAHKYRSEKTALEYIQNRPQVFKLDRPEVLTQLRYDVGDVFAADVMKVFVERVILGGHEQKSCDQFIGTCDFYLCQDQKNPCGLDSYNLSFGYKYCSLSKFKLFNKMSSDDGRQWVDKTFKCLQKKSYSQFSETVKSANKCALIKNESFNAHPDCYAQAGFCGLNFYDKLQIFNTIKAEILSAETVTQGVDLLQNCLIKTPADILNF